MKTVDFLESRTGMAKLRAKSSIGICSSLRTVANNSAAGITGGQWWVNRMKMPRPVVCDISAHSGWWRELSRRFFLQAIIVAAFLFFVTSEPAQSAPPALTIAPAGTNLLAITVTNGVGFGNYEVWWTPALGNPAANPWVKTAAGTGGQTNFLVNVAGYQSGFFRVLQLPAIGASTPFISYEAESGKLGGGATVVALTSPPTTEFSSPQLEASGHAYVHLAGTGQNVTLTNNTGKAITALNVRYSIPDAPTGGGISNTIDLYVGGTFRLQIPVTSFQTWVYEATTNYNGMSKNPTNGSPHVFWDETAFFVPGAAIPVGGTFTLQMDSSNTAAYYNLDVVDLETPPAPLAQPTNSLSIMSYGAQSNTPSFDNTTPLLNCAAAALAAGKSVWIPPGTFYINAQSSVKPNGVTIGGAGPWYSKFLYVSAAWVNGIFFHTTSTSFKNLCIDATGPNALPSFYAIEAGGANWTIDNVWARHAMLVWGSGTNCTVENSRVNNSFGDGMNLNNTMGQVCTNVLIYNNFCRGNGDDAIAVNSANTSEPPVQNATVLNNTTVASWWANQLGTYGGINIVISSNLFEDCVKKTGMELSGYSAPWPVNVTAQFNTLLRCGSFGYGIDQPAIIIQANGTNMTVNNNIISNAMFEAVQVSTGTYNLLFENNLIAAPGTTGIVIPSGTTGTGTFMSNIVVDLNSGQSPYINNASGTFTATVTGNSWQGGTNSCINFDVPGGVGGANYVGQGAYIDPGNNYWNAIVANGTTPAGTNSDGVTLSPITFTEAQTGSFQGGSYTTEGTPQALEYYYAYVNNSATKTCTLNNVPAGTYNLYLYGINGGTGSARSNRGTTFTVSSDSTPATSQSTVNTSSGFTSFIQGNSYVLFTNILMGAGSTITFTYSHNPNATNTVNPQTEGDFNGLQLQSQ